MTEFLDLACLCYDDPHYDHRSFHRRAQEMLRGNPRLSEANIWCASAAGNPGAVKAFLDKQSALVSQPGPHGWVPLICACYSRVNPTLDVVKLLLDHGADPNACTMKGNADIRLDQAPRRFSALTGLFGGGSTGFVNQPPHPQWRELAELLLTRGASPADEQALAVNQDACLEILLRHGLQPDAVGSDGVSLMGRALSQAARRGNRDAVRLLLAHGARTGEKCQGKTPWKHAIRLGHLEVARILEQAGAEVCELDDVGRFVSLCMAADEPAARHMLNHTPDLIARAPKDMVQRAVFTRRPEAVDLVLRLGFDPNYQDDNAALHSWAGDEEILRILLAHGASLKLRDPWYDSTPIGWADFGGNTALRDRLLTEPNICLFDALDFDRVDRVPDILARDPAALERPFAECLSRQPKPEDWQTPLARMIAQGKTGAAQLLREAGASACFLPAELSSRAASSPSGQSPSPPRQPF